MRAIEYSNVFCFTSLSVIGLAPHPSSQPAIQLEKLAVIEGRDHMTIWPRRPYTGAARSLWTCLLALMVGASVAGVAPSTAGAVAIANDFTGTGTLKLGMNFFSNNFVKCTSSTVKGTVSKPIPNQKATITSWSTEGCAIYRNNKNVGSATVKVTTFPEVEAVSLTKLYFGKFTVEATFQIGGSTCKPKFTVLADNPSYTNGSTTNKIESFSVDEFIDSTFPLPEVCEFAGGAEVSEVILSFTDPQFEVEEGNYKSPTVVTKAASELTQTGAKLNGEITPNGLSTEYHFEYGLTEKYGTSTPVPDASLTSKLYTAQSVSRTLTELLPGTTYHFRLVAKNAKGTTNGSDQTFVTSPPNCDYNYSSSIRTGHIDKGAKEDIYQFSSEGLWGWLATGSEAPPYTKGLGKIGSGFGSAYQDRLGDIDGDGDDDAFQVLDDGRVYKWLSNGEKYTGGELIASEISVGGACEIRTLDMDGDGKDDLMRFTSGGNGYAWLSNGSEFTSVGQKGSEYGVPVEMRSADFNGDGKDDLLRFLDNGKIYGWESFATESKWSGFKALGTVGEEFGNNYQVQIGDSNNDGKEDIFRFTDKGEGFVSVVEAVPGGWWYPKPKLISKEFGGVSRQMKVADINGDGRADILKFADNGVGYGWRATAEGTYTSLGEIGSGFGAP